MALVALIGLVAVATQLFYVWRPSVARGAHVAEHFRSLLGMGISAYTAFLSVGLIRLVPDHVFQSGDLGDPEYGWGRADPRLHT